MLETVIEFIKTPGVYLALLVMIMSSITINYHNRLCNKHPDECGKEWGYKVSVLSIIVSILGLVYYLYDANRDAVNELGVRGLNKGRSLMKRN